MSDVIDDKTNDNRNWNNACLLQRIKKTDKKFEALRPGAQWKYFLWWLL